MSAKVFASVYTSIPANIHPMTAKMVITVICTGVYGIPLNVFFVRGDPRSIFYIAISENITLGNILICINVFRKI